MKLYDENPQTWVNLVTGQQITATTTVREVTRKNFEITYLACLTGVLEKLGGKKLEVFSYLLEHKNTDNIVIATVGKIAQDLSLSRSTIIRSLNILRDSGVISYIQDGVVMIAPSLMNSVSSKREQYLLMRFKEIQEQNESISSPNKEIPEEAFVANFYSTIINPINDLKVACSPPAPNGGAGLSL